ncbi:hypothetical protein [Lysinibacillus xylanilyticus]|uniref:Uncharacterized protein n=1 Tax=Lysinibacillus xylanilyticus TaxID=582475 RepID=A0ABT4ETV1_9BACI|nr:hypothetical protein [Lysinibacillus xylanilyticus]MCY9549100.1 hypothetical protein [Lysinibacillus xylanilyticus]
MITFKVPYNYYYKDFLFHYPAPFVEEEEKDGISVESHLEVKHPIV